MRSGILGSLPVPPPGSRVSARLPDWFRCGSSKRSSGRATGATGMPAFSASPISSALFSCGQAPVELGQEPLALLDPALVGVQAPVGREIGVAERLAHALPVPVGGDPDEDELAVGRGEEIVDRPGPAPVGHGRGRLARDGRDGHVLGHEEGDRFEQARLDELALPGRLPLVERGQDADHPVAAAHDVGHRGPGPQRPAGRAGHVGEAAHHLHHLVQRRPLFVGAGHEALERAVDQARVARAAGLIAHAQALDGFRPEVLDQDVRRFDQPQQQLFARRGLEVDGEASLVAVEVGEEAGPEPFQPAGVVPPAGAFDLVDVGPEVRQDEPGGRPHDGVPELQHLDPGERQGFSSEIILTLPSWPCQRARRAGCPGPASAPAGGTRFEAAASSSVAWRSADLGGKPADGAGNGERPDQLIFVAQTGAAMAQASAARSPRLTAYPLARTRLQLL